MLIPFVTSSKQIVANFSAAQLYHTSFTVHAAYSHYITSYH